MAAQQPKVVGWGLRAFGKKLMFPEYPDEESFFLPSARQFRAAGVDAADLARRHQRVVQH